LHSGPNNVDYVQATNIDKASTKQAVKCIFKYY